MNIWSKYVAYLKDNPEGYWFKRKLYGYGWTPATKEGWITILVFVLALTFIVHRVGPAPSDEAVLREVIGPTFILILLLLVISWKKGESPKWMWGEESRGDSARPSEEFSERSD
ncbi:MAG: hypothetical protein ACI9VM_000745 [Candidatus Azotimanducaceae bacterium]|jgi:hypothetical protein